MNNSKKKTVPTLVGGAILLSSSAVHAVEGNVDNSENQVLENESVEIESGDIIIEVDGEILDDKLENAEIIVDSNKEIVIDSNAEVVNTEELVEVEDVVVVEEGISSEIKVYEEFENLLPKEKSTSQQKVMKVKVNSLSVRADIDKNSEVKGTLTKDTYIDVYAQDSIEGWSKINYKGEMAYVNTSDLIDVTTVYKEANKDNVVVKSGAGESYGDFGTLSKGDRIKVYQELDNGWSKVDYDSKIAFILTENLDKSYTSTVTVEVDEVKVYKNASDTSEVLGQYKKSETLLIYEESSTYYKVKFSDGYGYVKKSDLNIKENTEKPQTGDMMIFSYLGATGVSSLGFVAVNRKNKKQ